MTASGTYSFNPAISDMVVGAYERVQIRAPSLRQEHWVTARREINMLFSEMSNRQVNLFSVQFGDASGDGITLVQGQAVYDVADTVVQILDAYITVDGVDRYITPLSRTSYASIATKDTQGFPTSYWFDRLINSQIYLWPTPDSNGPYVLNYYAAMQLQDANIPNGETAGVPYRWLDVVISGLAARLARVYAPQMYQAMHADYERAWTIAATQDTEAAPLTISLNLRPYYPR